MNAFEQEIAYAVQRACNKITLDCITAVNIADELIKQLKGGKDGK